MVCGEEREESKSNSDMKVLLITGKETGIFKYFDDTKAGTVIATQVIFLKGDGS